MGICLSDGGIGGRWIGDTCSFFDGGFFGGWLTGQLRAPVHAGHWRCRLEKMISFIRKLRTTNYLTFRCHFPLFFVAAKPTDEQTTDKLQMTERVVEQHHTPARPCQKIVTMQQNMVVRSTAFVEITQTLQILPKLYVNLANIKVIFNRSCEGYPNSAI